MQITKPIMPEITDPDKKDSTNTGEVKQPPEDNSGQKDNEPDPGEQDPEKSETPQPTVTIETINEENGAITISGTSTELPEGETVTITLADSINMTTTTDEKGVWSVTIPAAEATGLAAGTTDVTAAAKKATADSSFEYTPAIEPVDDLTWPIPPPNTVLSKRERKLMEADQLIDYDAVTGSMTALPTGKPVDRIGTLPYKDRDEVYEQFIQFVEAEYDLPFFREAAELMAEIDINLGILAGHHGIGSPEYKNYLEEAEIQQGYHHTVSPISLQTLEILYFEEKPEDTQYIGGPVISGAYSRYWIILEYYRLQLEHPNLTERLRERTAGSFGDMRRLFRESIQKGYVFGLDNPWA